MGVHPYRFITVGLAEKRVQINQHQWALLGQLSPHWQWVNRKAISLFTYRSVIRNGWAEGHKLPDRTRMRLTPLGLELRNIIERRLAHRKRREIVKQPKSTYESVAALRKQLSPFDRTYRAKDDEAPK